VLQYVAALAYERASACLRMQCVAGCGSVLQCVLQCVVACAYERASACLEMQCVAGCGSVLQCVF